MKPKKKSVTIETHNAMRAKYIDRIAKMKAANAQRVDAITASFRAHIHELNERIGKMSPQITALERDVAALREVAALSRSRYIATATSLWNRCDVDIPHKALYDAIIAESNKMMNVIADGEFDKKLRTSIERDFNEIKANSSRKENENDNRIINRAGTAQ